MGTPNFNITEGNQMLYKNESNNILEKSAFNKPIIGEINFPYSNIKTHLYFTSSIKKPVKIISEEKNNQRIRERHKKSRPGVIPKRPFLLS